MRLPITFFLLVGVAVVTSMLDYEHAWKMGNEYEYLTYSRTLAGLDKMKRQYTGVQLKGSLIVQVKSPQTLQVKLSNPRYARIHTTLMDGPNTELPDQTLEYRQIPMSGKPFEVTLKHGLIRDLLVDREIPTWELNLLKSFMSQLQVDTQGENAVGMKSAQVPIDENSSITFTAVEDSVGGKCEVLYEIVPLPLDQETSDKLPMPYLRGDGLHYDVKKVKNYEKCLQRQVYHYGPEDRNSWHKQEKLYKQDKILSELSTTQMLLSGNLKQFTIQSVMTKNQISVKPGKSNPFLGNVHSTLKLILVKIDKISSSMLSPLESTNLESIGNLLYTYINPFSDSENRRLPSVSVNSGQMKSSESISSSSSESNMDDQSSSSSSSSNSEDHSLYKSIVSPVKTALHMAPNIPLLSQADPDLERAENLIYDIATEINDYYTPDSKIEEKYIYLKNSIRRFSLEQLTELQERINRNHRMNDINYKNIVYSIVRDVVARAGTGPALLTIQDWLKNKKIEGIMAARLLSQIPKYVLELTKEYIKTFYEMIIDPLILNQEVVNVSAPLAFAELLQIVSNRVGYYYPTRSFGSITLKDNEIIHVYIPHMAKQLKQGLLEDDSPKIQTYITALGLIGHPMILSVLEPYIEGSKPVSKFQRLLMISSLSTLSRFRPEIVEPIFYNLYSNEREVNEIRCMSVYHYIMSNPPFIMLQRVAKSTNFDRNDHVNSVIKSTINSLAETNRYLSTLNKKARSVKHLLNPKESSIFDSKGRYISIDNYGVKGINLQTIASDDSIIPIFVRIGVNIFDSTYRLPTLIVEHAVSSVKQFLHYIKQMIRSHQAEDEETNQELSQLSRIEKIMQVLQFKPQQLDKLEGHVFVSSLYEFLFYPYDGRIFRNISSQLNDFFRKNQKLDLVLFNNYETTLSLPTESGLPFIYTMESPNVIKLKVEMKKDKLSVMKKKGVLNTYVANKAQKRFGFVTPFENQNYMTGVDVNRMLQLPLEYEIELDWSQQLGLSWLKVRPLPQIQASPLTVLRLSTVPFTTRQDVLALEPLSLNKNTHLVLTGKKHKAKLEKDLISVRLEYDGKEVEENLLENNLLQLLRKWQAIPNSRYQKLELSMNPEQLLKSELQMNVVYETMAVDTKLQLLEPEKQTMISLKHVKPNSEKRRKEVMTGFSKDLNSGDVSVMDINLNFPMLQEQQVVTVGWMDSNVNKKSKVYFYWNSQIPMKEKPISEICYMHEIQNSPYTPLNFEHIMKYMPKDKIKVEMRYGESCSMGSKVIVDANILQSVRMKDWLENSNIVKQCRDEIRKGHKALQACQQAIELARVKDQMNVSVEPSASDYVREIIAKITDFLSHLFPQSDIKVTNPSLKNPETNTLDINITMSFSDVIPPTYLESPQMDVTFPHGETNIETQELLKENTMLHREIRRASCTMDKNMILTFDNLLYPVTLGNCKHVLLAIYPQKDPDIQENIMIPREMNVLILVTDNIDGGKIIDLMMGNHAVELKSDNGLKVIVDGVQLSQHRSYQLRQNGETILEIIELPDRSIEVISNKFDIAIVFDGQRIRLLASDKYRNAVRGLCGNYDSNPSTDFITPKNCIMKVPEIFAATYAIQEGCQHKHVLANIQKAEQAQCHEILTQYRNNVINDREAGRLPTYSDLWGYHHHNYKKKQNLNYDSKRHNVEPENLLVDSNIVYRTKVVLEDEEICFTTKPVSICREGSRPLERKTKKYDLYCQPRNEESITMKRRVEQGGNPDLIRKPVSRSRIFQVPVVCKA